MESSENSETLVLLDTNFLISAAKFGIGIGTIDDIIHKKNRIVVPTNVKKELDNIVLEGRDNKARTLAKKLSKHFESIEIDGNVDKTLLNFAIDNNAIVATNDKTLRKMLREAGVPVVFIRNRRYLAVEGYKQNI
ncbi:MAG: type II toxin-antitoxin system VapC family toxin [Candidatus Methanofastidiosia archaeon]